MFATPPGAQQGRQQRSKHMIDIDTIEHKKTLVRMRGPKHIRKASKESKASKVSKARK